MEIKLRFGDNNLIRYHYVKLVLTEADIEQMDGLVDACHDELKAIAARRGEDPSSVERPSIQQTVYWLNNDERNAERRWYYKKFAPLLELENELVPLVEHSSAVDGMVERPECLESPDDAWLDQLVARDNARKVRAALYGLPQSQRELLESIYFRDESQADIARREGVSRAAISKRHKRALANLRPLLEEQGVQL